MFRVLALTRETWPFELWFYLKATTRALAQSRLCRLQLHPLSPLMVAQPGETNLFVWNPGLALLP
jgi:hypothetical protein